MQRPKTRRQAILTSGWLASFFGVALSCATIYFVGAGREDFGDAADYLAAARSLLEGRGYPYECSIPGFRPPLYPLFIAAVWTLVPDHILSVKIAQALLLGATCRVLFVLGRLVHGDQAAAVIGSTLFALSPFFLIQAANIQTETLHTFAVAVAILFSCKAVCPERMHMPSLVAAGLTFGLAALCRTSAFGIGLLIAVSLPFLRRRGKEGLRTRMAATAILAGAMLAALAPWSIYTWHARRELVLLNASTGYAVWLGNHPDALPLYESSFKSKEEFDDLAYRHLQRDAPRAKSEEWEQSARYSSLLLREKDSLWMKEAVKNMAEQPSLTLRLWVHKIWAHWKPWLLPGPYSWAVVISSGIAVLILYVSAAAAVPRITGRLFGRRFMFLMTAVFAGSTMIHMASVSMVRYRLPYVDPYLSIMAGLTVRRASRGLMGFPRGGSSARDS